MSGRVAASAAAVAGSLLVGLAAVPALLFGAGATCTTPAPASTQQTTPRLAADLSLRPLASQPAAAVVAPVAGYDAEQTSNAATIVYVGAKLGVPVRGWVIAVAVAIQESSLRVLDHGDVAGPDSRGLFQQRSAWAPLNVRMDPAGSARLFYTGGEAGQAGLLDIDGWQAMPLTVAAQAVQHSANPDAYASRESDATALVAAVIAGPAGPLGAGGAHVACAVLPGPVAAQAVAYARAQLGLPYQWAGDGPGHGDAGFDCSGLTHAAYAAAGIDLPRTAQTQYDAGPRLPGGTQLLPGDLVFFGTPTHVHHVGIYLGNNQMVDAPHTGAVVRVEDYRWSDFLGASRPAATGGTGGTRHEGSATGSGSVPGT